VECDIIVLGFHIIQLVEGDHVHLCAVFDDHPLRTVGVRARGGDFRGELAFAEPGAGAFECPVKAVHGERLQEIIDRVRVEGAHSVLVEGGREDDGGTGLDQLQDFETIELGHLDVEKEQVGGVLRDGFDGFEAVGAFGGDLDIGVIPDEFAEKCAGELFVVNDHSAQHLPATLPRWRIPSGSRHVSCNAGGWMRARLSICWALIGAALCVAQTKDKELPPETTFRVGTDLVQLNVSVFDPNYKVIRGLPQSAFTVLENGGKQEIAVFRNEDVPVSMGLIVDNSASMKDKRERVVSAALAMVKASNPDDEVFVVNFSDEPELTQEFTSKPDVLEKGLRTVQSRGETAMRDAMLMAMQHLRSRAKRDKRVLVVITDGEDNASVASQQRLIEFAHQNNAIVYGIGLLGGEQPDAAARAKGRLEELTNATGGRAWFPPDVSAMAAITAEIAHEIRNQYVVGYTPTDTTKDGKFRKVTVEVNVPGAIVRTRAGYYARP
jgi:Ca-activated chloride channel family protein